MVQGGVGVLFPRVGMGLSNKQDSPCLLAVYLEHGVMSVENILQ